MALLKTLKLQETEGEKLHYYIKENRQMPIIKDKL